MVVGLREFRRNGAIRSTILVKRVRNHMGQIESFFIKEDEIREHIPDDYLDGVTGRRLFLSLYRGFAWDTYNEDNNVRGIALFVSHLERTDRYELRFINLSEENRYQGVGKLMLDNAAKVLANNTPVSITTNIPCEDIRESLLALLKRWGFEENGTEEKVVYSLGDLIDSDFYDTAIKKLSKTSQIFRAKDLVKKQIVDLAKRMEKEGRHFDIKDMDDKYSVFFVHDGKILGFLDMIESEPNVLCLKRLYIQKSEAAKYAMPLLLAKTLSFAEERMEGVPIFICQNRPKFTEYLVGVFGEPIDKQVYNCFIRR